MGSGGGPRPGQHPCGSMTTRDTVLFSWDSSCYGNFPGHEMSSPCSPRPSPLCNWAGVGPGLGTCDTAVPSLAPGTGPAPLCVSASALPSPSTGAEGRKETPRAKLGPGRLRCRRHGPPRMPLSRGIVAKGGLSSEPHTVPGPVEGRRWALPPVSAPGRGTGVPSSRSPVAQT